MTRVELLRFCYEAYAAAPAYRDDTGSCWVMSRLWYDCLRAAAYSLSRS